MMSPRTGNERGQRSAGCVPTNARRRGSHGFGVRLPALRGGLRQRCAVNLAQAGVIHVMVRGYADSSDCELVGLRD